MRERIGIMRSSNAESSTKKGKTAQARKKAQVRKKTVSARQSRSSQSRSSQSRGARIGTLAPDFDLTDKDSVPFRLSACRSRFIIVYFYPRDSTPGCTVEAQEFTRAISQFKRAGATIVGISGGDDASKRAFCEKYELGIRLLSDTDFSVAKKYGAYGEKQFMGRKFFGILRHTFVLDARRRVLKIFDSVKPAGHAQEVLEFIKSQSTNSEKL